MAKIEFLGDWYNDPNWWNPAHALEVNLANEGDWFQKNVVEPTRTNATNLMAYTQDALNSPLAAEIAPLVVGTAGNIVGAMVNPLAANAGTSALTAYNSKVGYVDPQTGLPTFPEEIGGVKTEYILAGAGALILLFILTKNKKHTDTINPTQSGKGKTI